MKFVNFILKFIGSIVGIMITSYVVALYFDFMLKTSLNEKNISKMISKIDLIDSSQMIFNTDDRIIERDWGLNEGEIVRTKNPELNK